MNSIFSRNSFCVVRIYPYNGGMKTQISSCGQLVRDHDPDRFLLSMFTQTASREALWALFAFNHEIAKTREVVSDSTLGHIRLKWWGDEIARIYEGKTPSSHEVLEPLAAAIKDHDLPRADFEKLLEAREFDLEDVLPGNLEGLLNYADFTTTPLMNLAVRMLGDEPDVDPVQPVAVNYALAGLLRGIAHHARAGRCYLPEDLMKKHAVEKEKLFAREPQDGLRTLVEEVAVAHVTGVKPGNVFLKGLDHLAAQYFRQIKGLKYDVMSPRMALDPPFKVLRLIFRTKFM